MITKLFESLGRLMNGLNIEIDKPNVAWLNDKKSI